MYTDTVTSAAKQFTSKQQIKACWHCAVIIISASNVFPFLLSQGRNHCQLCMIQAFYQALQIGVSLGKCI